MGTRKRKNMRRKRTRRQRGGSTETHTAIIIEPRSSKQAALEFVINNIIETLDNKWNLIIFHGPDNGEKVRAYVDGLSETQRKRITLENIDKNNMNTEEYNELMMSHVILDKIPTEMFLIVQTDSMLCGAGIKGLDKFMKYDYVGAPWKDTNTVGNGGFSLRRKSVMKRIVDKCSRTMKEGVPHNEDGFFSVGCDEVPVKKPSVEEAKEFAVETMYNDKAPVGLHKTWYFNPEKDMEPICRGYNKLRELNGGQSGGTKPPLKIGLMAIFKNESMVMREWIEHYKWQGVDHILLLNNNSDDDWQGIVKDYEGFVTVKDAPEKYAQMKYYNTVGIPFLKEKGMDVLVTVDFDEYFFGRDGRLLKDYIQEVFNRDDRPATIICGWTMFGSNGHKTQPESVRKGFTMRWSDKTEPADGLTAKSITMLSDIPEGGLTCQHMPKINGRRDACPAGLQLNHYAIMSKEYFDKVKKTRGDVFKAFHENVRDDAYFNRYDNNKVSETLLADQVEAYNKSGK